MQQARQASSAAFQVQHWCHLSPWMQVPDDILHNDALNEAAAVLPANYSFEVACLFLTPSANTPEVYTPAFSCVA